MSQTAADRLRRARLNKMPDSAAADAARRFGWNVNTYSSNENGNATFSFKKAREYASAYGVRAEWLYEGSGDMHADLGPDLVRVIGYVGASQDGAVQYATGDSPNAFAPRPPGGTTESVALEVNGHSMRNVADDGALIYFEDQRTPPSPDMLGHVVILETDDDRVLVKRLLRGSEPGLYDLESVIGETLTDVRIRWAAHITAIIPPHQARRVIRRTGEAA